MRGPDRIFENQKTCRALCWRAAAVVFACLNAAPPFPLSSTWVCLCPGCCPLSPQPVMPGGLASWLGDDEVAIKAKLPRRPRPPPSRAAPVIDVDAAPPAVTAEGGGGGKTNRLQAPTEKEAWDPFSSKGTREDASQNAFALLRKGAAARHPTAATSSASTPSPPAWREGSRPPASSWDPFGASAADEKENRGNAFSKLLAAPTSQQQHSSSSTQKGRSSFGAPGKKAKLSSGGGGSPEAGAVTRFCECPVCGKRVRFDVGNLPRCIHTPVQLTVKDCSGDRFNWYYCCTVAAYSFSEVHAAHAPSPPCSNYYRSRHTQVSIRRDLSANIGKYQEQLFVCISSRCGK